MSDARQIPYPHDTRAKGWRFEIDYEKIEQSDTWSLAAELPMAQPALLMMWVEAWKQAPVGSFPNDESIIRAKCKIPPATWAKVRPVLMRGWWLADDGRLYHDTIVQRVLAMLDKRATDAQRAATRRARLAGERDSSDVVTGASRVTPPRRAREFDTKHQAPSTSNSVPIGTGGAAASDAELTKAELWTAGKSLLAAQGMAKAQCGSFVGKLCKDWTDAIVIEAVRITVVKRPADAAEFLVATCQTLAGQRDKAEPGWRTEQRERTQIAAPGVAVGGKSADQFFIDAEVKHVTANSLD